MGDALRDGVSIRGSVLLYAVLAGLVEQDFDGDDQQGNHDEDDAA